MNKKQPLILLLYLSSLIMVDIVSAAALHFQDPATAAWGGWDRGDAETSHGHWDVFEGTGTFDFDSSPDIADLNNASTTVFANNPGAFITGTNNVYSFSDVPDWSVEIVPGYTLSAGTVTIVLQLRVLGRELDFDTVNLGLTDNTANYTSAEQLFLGDAGGPFGGSAEEAIFIWENVPVAPSYALNFLSQDTSLSLDDLVFDIGGFVPAGSEMVFDNNFSTSGSLGSEVERFTNIIINDGVILTLNDNAYTNALSIGEGASGGLLLTAADLIDDNAAVTVNSGAIFDLQGNNDSIGSLAGAGNTNLGAAALTTGADDSSTDYSGELSGTGSLTKQGAGTMTLTGSNTYTGATIINGGSLLVNGSNNNSLTTVNAGGILGGTGTTGTVNISGGIIAPGNSIGTINIDGNVDFSGGGIYRVEVDSAGSSDLINATGTATLTDGVVQVLPLSGSYAQSTDYTILSAAGGLGGTSFASVSSDLVFLTPTLSYTANNVLLNLTRNTSTFSIAADTPNQIAVATTLTNLEASSSAGIQNLINEILVLTEPGAQQAFDSLSGVQHTHSQLLMQQIGYQFQQLLLNRGRQTIQTRLAFNSQANLSNTTNKPDSTAADADAIQDVTESAWWLQGFGGAGDIDGTVNASGADYNTQGFAIGVETEKRAFVIGAAGSYASTKADTFGGSTDIDSFQLGGYGEWRQDSVYLNTAVGLGYHAMNAERNVIVGAAASRADADYSAWHVGAGIESGKDFVFSGASITLTPFVGAEYLHSNLDGFTEVGADNDANLQVNEVTGESLRASLGLRLDRKVMNSKGLPLIPYLDVIYVHEFLDTINTMESAFIVGSAQKFNISGAELDRNRVRISAGIIEQLSENTQLQVAYNGEIASSDEYHGFQLTLRFAW